MLPKISSDETYLAEKLANTVRHFTTQNQYQQSSRGIDNQSDIQRSQMASYRSHREKMHESAPITV